MLSSSQLLGDSLSRAIFCDKLEYPYKLHASQRAYRRVSLVVPGQFQHKSHLPTVSEADMQQKNPPVLKQTDGGKAQLTSDICQEFCEGPEREDEARYVLKWKTALYA